MARTDRILQVAYALLGRPVVGFLGGMAIAALIIFSAFVHILFSPWLLLAIAIVAFIKFRPRRSRQ